MKKKRNKNFKNEAAALKNNNDKFVFFEKYSPYLIISALLFLTFVLIRTAWLCDDAFITLRTIDNFVNGFGLRFNVIERVQAYTHPLWLFLITIPYYFLRDPFYTPIIISILITVFLSIIASYKISSSKYNAFLFILLLVVSKSFIDYSTSGLENALSHLIAVLFIWIYIKDGLNNKKIFLLSLISSLALLNRMDSVLFYLPALIDVFLKSKNKKSLFLIVAGLTPFIIWTLFSLIYYGYPFPNTFYAKLNTGIPKTELFSQGLYYFYNSLKFDPITIIVIFTALAFILIKREKKYYPISAGVLLYMIYIIYIGGDFMSGRFFSLAFIISLAILSTIVKFTNYKAKIAVIAAVMIFMFLSPNPPVLSGLNYSDKDANFLEEHGISDERGFYYHNASLWKAMNGEKMPNHPMQDVAKRHIEMKEKAFLAGAIGFFGYYAGPSVFVVDVYALSDPLLAKLHVVSYDPIFGVAYEKKFKMKSPKSWRIGHFLRPLPPGYTLSILKGESLIDDKNLNELYGKIRIITQGDLFSAERLSMIIKMNLGYFDYLIDYTTPTEYVETNFHDDLIRYKPDFARYYYSRGNYFFRRTKYDKSIPDLEKAVEIQKDFSLAWYKLSIAQYYTGRYESALKNLITAKDLGEKTDPDFENAIIEKIKLQKTAKEKI